jgi:hypothetical protein
MNVIVTILKHIYNNFYKTLEQYIKTNMIITNNQRFNNKLGDRELLRSEGRGDFPIQALNYLLFSYKGTGPNFYVFVNHSLGT